MKQKIKSAKLPTISDYIRAQDPRCSAICRALKKEIEATLPKALSKLYHGSPVWFMGDNAVVGFSVTSKKAVTLLFWNGQAFKESALVPVGKFEAAQIQFLDKSEINFALLRRLFKRAGRDIWDFAKLRSSK